MALNILHQMERGRLGISPKSPSPGQFAIQGMESGQGKRALTRERARISLVITNAAALFDVLDPLPDIGMVLAREIALHELSHELRRTVLCQVGSFGTRKTSRRIGIDQSAD